MRQYELTYLLSDQVSESDMKKVTGKIGGFVSGLGGKVLKEESWGRRKLAYPIGKENFASYFTLYFELDSENTKKFEAELKEVTGLIRHLLIVSDFGKKELSLDAEEVADTEEIEEVAGGEKSFEAVEGETEKSKDLMKVRKEDSEEEEDKEGEEESKEDTKDSKKEQDKKTEKDESEEKEEDKKDTKTKKEKETEKTKKSSKKEKKKVSKTKPKTKKSDNKGEDDADRLAKLDEELEDILKEDEE